MALYSVLCQQQQTGPRHWLHLVELKNKCMVFYKINVTVNFTVCSNVEILAMSSLHVRSLLRCIMK